MSTITNGYVYQMLPSREWLHHVIGEAIITLNLDREKGRQEFDVIWAGRAPIKWIEGPPPRPKRPENAPQEDKLIEGGSAVAFHRAVLRAFHSDHHGQRSYTGDEVVAVINRLWNETSLKT